MEKFDNPGVNLALYPFRLARLAVGRMVQGVKEGAEIALLGQPQRNSAVEPTQTQDPESE